MCVVEGARAGAAVARHLRGEIEGAQGQVEFMQSPDIDPQRWYDQLRHPGAKICIPVPLKVANDLYKRRLVLLTDQLEIQLSNKQAFMRRRRAGIDFNRMTA